MQVMTPAGIWTATEDFNASASIQSLIDFLIEEMNLGRGDIFEIVGGNHEVIPPETPVGLVCDSRLELVATGFSI